jgi:hypothetical protein
LRLSAGRGAIGFPPRTFSDEQALAEEASYRSANQMVFSRHSASRVSPTS